MRGWSTEERRSSVREGTRVIRELRCAVVCLGSRRRRRSLDRRGQYSRSLDLVRFCGVMSSGEWEYNLQRAVKLVDFRHRGCVVCVLRRGEERSGSLRLMEGLIDVADKRDGAASIGVSQPRLIRGSAKSGQQHHRRIVSCFLG